MFCIITYSYLKNILNWMAGELRRGSEVIGCVKEEHIRTGDKLLGCESLWK